MTTTTTVTDNDGREFTVKLNSYSKESAVWLMGSDSDNPFDGSGTFSLEAARQLRDDLITVIADVEEALKPKPLTTTQLDNLDRGTIVYIDGYGEYREFIKTDDGRFVRTTPGTAVGRSYESAALHSLTLKKEVN